MTIRDIFISFGYQVDKPSEKKANDSIASLKSTATKLLGAIGIGFSLVKLKDIAEEFNGINDQIRDATRGMGDQAEIQKTVLKAANDTKQTYADMADSVSKLAQNRDVFSGVEDAANFASLLAKNFASSGKGAGEVNALMKSVTTSMSRGHVDSRAMMALLRESPSTLRMIADSLGVTVDALQDMVGKGEVSAKTLKEVFEKNADGINGRFEELDYSISDALLNIRNQWGHFVDSLNSATGLTQTMAKLMVRGFTRLMDVLRRAQSAVKKLNDLLGGGNNLLKLMAIVGGSIFAALNAAKILTFVKALREGLGAIKLQTVAIVAVIALVALAIEDLVNFVAGNDSLIGELFKKFGIDGDAVREAILGVLEAAKKLLPVAMGLAKQFGGAIVGALRRLMPMFTELLRKILPPIADLFGKIAPMLADMGRRIIPLIADAVGKVMPFLFSLVERVLPLIISLVAAILPLALQFIESVLPVMISLLEAVLPVMVQIVTAVLPVVLELVAAILPLALQIIESVLPVILELITAILPILTPIIELVANLVTALLPPIISLLNAILPILEPILGVLKPIADILGVIIGAIAKVVDWVAKGFSWVIDVFTGGGGGEIKTDSDGNPVKGYATGTDRTPDTFVAGEEGPELITGAKGRKVFTAAQTGDVFGTLASIASMALNPRVDTVAAASGTSVDNRSVVQNVNITNQFSGDRAGQQKSAEAMGKAADDATSRMARGLAYVRG